MSKLIDVVANLTSYDPELTVYAAKPWTCRSEAIVAGELEGGGLPPEVLAMGADYFVEVFVAKEFLEGWLSTAHEPVSERDQCERLIAYAINDA